MLSPGRTWLRIIHCCTSHASVTIPMWLLHLWPQPAFQHCGCLVGRMSFRNFPQLDSLASGTIGMAHQLTSLYCHIHFQALAFFLSFNAFTVCIRTENQNQVSFYPFVLHEISVLIELTLGHLRYRLTDVPPQPNSHILCCTGLSNIPSLLPARECIAIARGISSSCSFSTHQREPIRATHLSPVIWGIRLSLKPRPSPGE